MENIEKFKVGELLVKKPFFRTISTGVYDHPVISGKLNMAPVPNDNVERKLVTQEDFLRELDPLGHAINNRELFPDIWRQNEEDGKWYIEEIPRYAISYELIILTKHLTHLCGNDVRFELSDKKVTDETNEIYNNFVLGWANKNMEIAWYKLCKSVKSTGDGAVVGFLDNGKFGWKVLSFANGDILYPHYDKYTGKLKHFARKFSEYDETGVQLKEYVEVWDDTNYYRFANNAKANNIVDKVKNLFKVSGFELEESRRHGFEMIPVAYYRDDFGPCWTFSQETIENYEIAFSNLAQSNHDFGLPIMYLKGEGSEEVSSRDLSYASKIMLLPTDGEIGFVNKQDASAAYKTEIDKLEELIYKQSFAVKTPELKSGDTPGVSLKIMYSDAYEKAMIDSNEYDEVLDTLVDIYSFGYGVESGNQLAFRNTNIRHYIEPYIHRNETELTTNLNTSVVGGFLSKQTASEKSPYATPNEWERIQRENKEEQQHELLLQEEKVNIQNDANVEMQEQLADIEVQKEEKIIQAQETTTATEDNGKTKPKASRKRKYSVATGRGAGRPNKSGRKYDENGNWEGRQNWDNWNNTH